MTDELAGSVYDHYLPGWRDAKRVGGNHRVRSPLREDRDPSFDVHLEKLTWFDRGLQQGGGAIDLVRLMEGDDGVQALLRKLEGEAPPAPSRTQPIPRKDPDPQPQVDDLGEPTSAQIGAMKRSRRITHADSLAKVGARHVRARFWDRERKAWRREREYLGFPAFKDSWKLYALNANGVPYMKEDGTLLRPNVGPVSVVATTDCLEAATSKAPISRLYDVEGESDLLAAVDVGVAYAVTTTGGAGSTAAHDRHAEWLRALRPTEVVVVGDRDEPGRKGAEKRARWWLDQGVLVRVLDLPKDLGEKGDLRDFLLGRPARDGKPKQEPLGNAAALGGLADASELRAPSETQDPRPDSPTRAPILVRMSDVTAETVTWTWEPYLPRKKNVLLIGDPGLGKTYLALRIAAAISNGTVLPDQQGTPTLRCEQGTVLYMTAEDGLADTLRPRLDGAEADPSRITVLDGLVDGDERKEISLSDLDVIEDALVQVRPQLVVVDPIQGYLGARVDMHRANEVRPLLAGLGRLAEQYDCTVLSIQHLRKSGSDRAIHRGLGSIDFAAAARSILAVGEDPDEPSRRVIAHVKSSLAPKGVSLAFEIREGAFYWCPGVSELTADDLLGPLESPQDRGGRAEAEEFLLAALTEGRVLAKQVQKQAEELGIAARTLKRAKQRLGVRAEREGFGRDGQWYWVLPIEAADDRSSNGSGEPGPIGGHRGPRENVAPYGGAAPYEGAEFEEGEL